MSGLKYWLWLTTRQGLDAAGVLTVLDYFVTPERAYYADREEYDQLPLAPKARSGLYSKELDSADRILGDCQRLSLRIMTLRDGDYPERLRQISAPPAVLYVRGKLFDFDEEAAIAVVGSRRPSQYGEMAAAKLGMELAAGGALVLSGIAEGLDTCALKGALKAGGPVVSVGNLLNHANVSAGEALLTLGSSTIDADIRAKQEQINTAQQELEAAQKGIENFNAVAPIDGVVFSCALEPGQTVKEGDTVITISNTTTMLVDIQVDNRNIGFIKAGMTMELTDQATNTPYTGTVTKVAMQGEVGSGMTTYPVQLSVDNFDGSLTSGAWLSYKLVTSEAVDCITVPNQSVRRVTDVDGNIHTVVFVQADSKPENAIEIAPSTPQEGMPEQQNTMPTPEEGFWPVPVTIGISDTYNVEIKDGIEAGTPVFTNRETDQSAGW